LDAVTGIPASAGFCEPVEGYADSPMSITATVKAMAYEVGRLNKQLAAAKEENERVRQANLHTMDVFEDMKAAKEKAEARVAELEGSIKHAIGWIDGDLRELIRDMGNTVCTYNDLYDAADRIEAILVQSLRQQADEAERAGGDGD